VKRLALVFLILFGFILGIAFGQLSRANLKESFEKKKEEVRYELCRDEFLKASECYSKFGSKVCENESRKACDPTVPNYHGQMPKRKK